MTQDSKRSLIFLDEPGRRGAELMQEWAKVVLDFLRNVVVVALLFLLSEKSGKWYIEVVAWIGYFALFAYATAYLGQLQSYIGWVKNLFLKIVLMLAIFVVVGVIVLGAQAALLSVILEVARVQKM
jgi:hypothetical protein